MRDLSVSFVTEGGMARVLDAVSLSLAPGEIMGLVGESGCGKTTLARAILGALPANANVQGGALMFDGQDLLTLDPATLAEQVRGRAITFVPQDPYSSFSPLFTVGDQIMELMRWKSPDRRAGERFYRARRRRADRERALALLRAVQLPDPERLLRKYPHELSGGQRQRVMIAMALLPEPQAGDRRRTDDGARRDDPGADPEAAAPAGDRARRVGAVRHARPRHRLGDLRPRHGDVRRPGTGDRADRRVLPRADGAVHAAAAGQPAIERFAAARHCRRRAEPGRAAARLPLSSALSARRAMRAATSIRRRSEPEPGHQVRCHHPHLQPVVAA